MTPMRPGALSQTYAMTACILVIPYSIKSINA